MGLFAGIRVLERASTIRPAVREGILARASSDFARAMHSEPRCPQRGEFQCVARPTSPWGHGGSEWDCSQESEFWNAPQPFGQLCEKGFSHERRVTSRERCIQSLAVLSVANSNASRAILRRGDTAALNGIVRRNPSSGTRLNQAAHCARRDSRTSDAFRASLSSAWRIPMRRAPYFAVGTRRL